MQIIIMLIDPKIRIFLYLDPVEKMFNINNIEMKLKCLLYKKFQLQLTLSLK